MKLLRDQMLSTRIECRVCGKSKLAVKMQYTHGQADGIKYLYVGNICGACWRSARKRGLNPPYTLEVFVPTEPAPLKDLYTKKDPETGRGGHWCPYTKAFFYKKYCKTHRRIQATLEKITKAGLSLDREEDCAIIDEYLKGNSNDRDRSTVKNRRRTGTQDR